MKITYSDTFAHTITSYYGSRGSEWLSQLPDIIEECALLWNLSQLTPYENLTYGYVLAGMQGSLPVVLKLRCDVQGIRQEMIALAAFKGFGCVALLEHSDALGALLLERAVLGTSLTRFFPERDLEAIAITSDLIKLLHKAPLEYGARFKPLDKLLPNFSGHCPLLEPFLGTAESYKNRLLTTADSQVLLHGDLHYDNIVAHDTTWSIIDPFGAVGDPIYDVAVCIRHPLTELLKQPNPCTIIHTRIEAFASNCGWSLDRVYAWTYVQAAASAWWTIEDGLDAGRHVQFLRTLEKLSCIRWVIEEY